MSLADDLKKQTDDFWTKKIDYQVDTLDVASATGVTLGYYSSGANTITVNYHENDERYRDLEENGRDAILYHEQKHRSNNNKGFKADSIRVAPEQYYKLCMADEISANMATLVYLREEYIKTRDINVFDKDGGRFSFYKEAVQKGDVNPFSSDPKAFEKEMSLIMNGTQKMWEDRYATLYAKTHTKKTQMYSMIGNVNFEGNEAEYQKQLDIAYTIGGVNFKQYMQKDIEIPIESKQIMDIIKKIGEQFGEEVEEKSLSKRCTDKMGRLRYLPRDKVANLSEKKEQKAPEQKAPEQKELKDYLKNYPQWSKDKRVSEIQYKEMLDLDKPVITGIPAAQRSQSASPKNTSAEIPASTAQNVTVEKNNKDKAAYLRSLSGRTPQSPRARISLPFSQMRGNENSLELLLLRRQKGR